MFYIKYIDNLYDKYIINTIKIFLFIYILIFKMKSKILLPTYDWDGNIIHPKTSIVFYDNETWQDIEVSSDEYLKNKDIYKYSWRYKLHDDLSISFNSTFDFHWYDWHRWPDGLLSETKDALDDNLLSPSFINYKKEALIEANIFATLTARGHGSDNIQRATQFISNETLTIDEKKDQKEHIKEKYHKLIKEYNINNDILVQWFFTHIPSYMWINNQNFCKSIGISWYQNDNTKKVLAIDNHYRRVKDLYSTIWDIDDVIFAKWFSDDNIDNIVSMCQYYISESKVTDDKYRLYFSGKKEDRDTVKDKIRSLTDGDKIKFDNDDEIIMKISV